MIYPTDNQTSNTQPPTITEEELLASALGVPPYPSLPALIADMLNVISQLTMRYAEDTALITKLTGWVADQELRLRNIEGEKHKTTNDSSALVAAIDRLNENIAGGIDHGFNKVVARLDT